MRYAESKQVPVLLVLLAAAAIGCSKPAPSIEEEPASGASLPDAMAPAGSVLVCPTDLPGPKLVQVPAAGVGSFCMDARETTRGEYDAFVAAKAGDLGGQPAECFWNDSFTPFLFTVGPENELPEGVIAYCEHKSWEGVPADWPVTCVDFCDALAYCEWAGKRLCGRVGGPAKWGRIYVAYEGYDEGKAFSPVAKSVEIEFVAACTQGGATKYPYGDQYEPGRCIDSPWVKAHGKSLDALTDPPSGECHGTKPPYDAIHDLSGSVEEWQNLCDKTPGVSKIGAATVGSSAYYDYPSYVDNLSCTGGYGTGAAYETHAAVGFRCCADAVPAK
ncbi:MAG: SUMF1/EgtB/PvdO family nonheme iron enzyme [Deltaproteobacteria bacterium]|nr:SUMF1/EgtB/PvdO family nonheme iron enzyme [Deltaproteobacteria bacterium]